MSEKTSWGEAMKAAGYIRLPRWILPHLPHLGEAAIKVAVALLDKVDCDGSCFPSYKTIGEVTGLSKASIQRGVRTLVKAGILEFEARNTENGRQTSNTYKFTLPPAGEGITVDTPHRLEGITAETGEGITADTLIPLKKVKKEQEGAHTSNQDRFELDPTPPEDSNGKPKRKRTTFKPPTLEEVRAYCRELNSPVDPEYWVDYHIARGWRFKGGEPMRDWQATIRNWGRNNVDKKPDTTTTTTETTYPPLGKRERKNK